MPNAALSLYVVQTNPVPGQETAYNDWYTRVHLPEILSLPGFVSAQRFALSGVQRSAHPTYPYSYLALYEIAGNPREAFGALDAARSGLTACEALAPERAMNVFEPLTQRLVAAP